MLTSVSGYYDGNEIVMDEAVDLFAGQRVIITILDTSAENENHCPRPVNLDKYVGRGEKMFSGNIDDFVKELRSNDRI
ncbi:MAG: hypothetical protein IJI14_04485 [Anaerolineaceae bacterium]|nr:hypothetical protein [Anaerolineaceae bacterium]